jgi:hypothetical protein
VDAEQAPPQSARSPKVFVETVLDFFKVKYGEWPSEGRKLIVRCRSKEQIEQIGHFMRVHQAGASLYADRQFRRRFGFNMSEVDVRRSLRLPLRCHLYEVTQRKSMSKLAAATEERLVDGEYPSRRS